MEQEVYDRLQRMIADDLETQLKGCGLDTDRQQLGKQHLANEVKSKHIQYRIGVSLVGLDRCEEAQPWLRPLAEISRIPVPDPTDDSAEFDAPIRELNRGFRAAILTGEWEVIQRAGAELFEMFHTSPYRERIPDTLFVDLLPLSCLVVSQEIDACIEWLDWLAGDRRSIKPEGLRDVLQGVQRSDSSVATRGIERLLYYHREVVDNHEFTPQQRLVSEHATAPYVIAVHQGVNIDIETSYIPDCLLSSG